MKRMLFVSLFGLCGGLLAHFGWLTAHQPNNHGGLDTQLSWMKTQLHLTAEQYDRIKALHEQSNPQLLALAAQVARMRTEFAAFEQGRRTSGQIDFLEFARFVEQRRAVDRECATSTQRLIVAAADVMNPQQRQQYLALFQPERMAHPASQLN